MKTSLPDNDSPPPGPIDDASSPMPIPIPVAKHHPLLQVVGLTKIFPQRRHWPAPAPAPLRAVDQVNLLVEEGETVAVVGESGCGKTTLGRLILGLLPPTSGSVRLAGIEQVGQASAEFRRSRPSIQAVFQDPQASLDPRMRVTQILREPLRVQGKTIDGKIEELLRSVGLSPEVTRRYPHQLSGGQRQRVGIARALALQPKLIVADEPTSALDVSIRVQILNLLRDLQRESNVSFLLISHDLASVRHYSQRVIVLHRGRVVEEAPTPRLFEQPLHPYTQALLAACLPPDPGHLVLDVSEGISATTANALLRPAAVEAESACTFLDRCPHADDRCREDRPRLVPFEESHQVACHHVSSPPGPESASASDRGQDSKETSSS